MRLSPDSSVSADDGSAEYGRLEVFHNGGWGTVRDNSFFDRRVCRGRLCPTSPPLQLTRRVGSWLSRRASRSRPPNWCDSTLLSSSVGRSGRTFVEQLIFSRGDLYN